MRASAIIPFVLLNVITIGNACQAQKKTASNNTLLPTIQTDFEDGAKQYKVLKALTPADSFPKTYHLQTGKNEFSKSGWWCSGFYPGTLLYLYEQTHDTALYNEAVRKLSVLQKEQFNKGTHDLGFMMYCSFGNANRLKPSAQYKEILLNSARSLSTRFNPTVGCIKSWDSKNPSDFLVIIDNMMNLELLFAATRLTGDSSFYKIAVSHANTTMKNHFRPDYSSYHVVDYDTVTGKVVKRNTHQGYADESAWARGQAWGLYAYTMCYRETNNVAYLKQAENIAAFILHHPNLPADKIPYWDFNAPNIPNEPRDASAAGVIASGLFELAKYSQNKKEYLTAANIILQNLTNKYRSPIGENKGFILLHSTGSKPQNSEVDVPINYGDYYYLEALLRSAGGSKK